MKEKTIYHVHLHTPFAGKSDYYFSSKVGIVRTLPLDVVGIRPSSLQNTRIDADNYYANTKCIITLEEVVG